MKRGFLYFFLCLMVLPFSSLISNASMGEGTGHHRVVRIISFPKSRVIINYRKNYLKISQIPISKICMIILNNNEVYTMGSIEEMLFHGPEHTFGNLESLLIKNGGQYWRTDILAIVLR